jgi:hypothetical protein
MAKKQSKLKPQGAPKKMKIDIRESNPAITAALLSKEIHTRTGKSFDVMAWIEPRLKSLSKVIYILYARLVERIGFKSGYCQIQQIVQDNHQAIIAVCDTQGRVEARAGL